MEQTIKEKVGTSRSLSDEAVGAVTEVKQTQKKPTKQAHTYTSELRTRNFSGVTFSPEPNKFLLFNELVTQSAHSSLEAHVRPAL